MKKKLKDFYDMIDEIDVAMMTTRRPDGYLVSRPMAMQERTAGADLWFVTSQETDKLDEILTDPHVNLSWYKSRTREWVSVAGTAHLTRDQKIIRKLWDPSWKIWFPSGAGKESGTPRDPRIIMIGVEIHSAVYMEVDKPQPVVLFEMVKGLITKEAPDVGTIRKIGPSDLRARKTRSRKSATKKSAKKSTKKSAKSAKKSAKSSKKSAKKSAKSAKKSAKKSGTKKTTSGTKTPRKATAKRGTATRAASKPGKKSGSKRSAKTSSSGSKRTSRNTAKKR